MTRTSWMDADHHPMIDEHVSRLEHFTKSMADGVISKDELAKQEKNLVAAMEQTEKLLDDKAHEAVTRLLAEMAAYAVMETLHSFTQARLRQAIK